MRGEDASPVATMVTAAQAGDLVAWQELMREFQDVTVGLAVGLVGNIDDARDIAQDALLLSFEHVDELENPAAFPGWLARIVRTAASRHHRRPRPLARDMEMAAGVDDDVVGRMEAARVRAGIEALPAHERSVVALHYLAGLSYPAIADFLGVSTAAVKKRAFSARSRLKGLLPSVEEGLAAARPSRGNELSDPVALFIAIRRGDTAMVRRLMAGDPGLLGSVECWTPEEAMRLGVANAEDGIPLVRAVATGNLEMTKLLLDAGAAADQTCACVGRETALWTAVHLGYGELVELLLESGADVNFPAFGRVTPMLLAAQCGDTAMVERLRSAGADTDAADDRGRTPADWLLLGRRRTRATSRDEFLTTGIRALDLFAPVPRNSLQHWPPAWEVGAFAVLYETVRSIGADEFWQVGFESGPYDATSAEVMLRQLRLSARVELIPSRLDPATAREHFGDALHQLRTSPGSKVVLLLTAPGHTHDTTVAAAELKADTKVITTFVVTPGAEAVATEPSPPEGYDLQVVFDRERARQGLWPAIDPRFTVGTQYTSEEHLRIASAARRCLFEFQRTHPSLPPSDAVPAGRLLQYLQQPFIGWEHLTGEPGQSTPLAETLREVDRLVDGDN